MINKSKKMVLWLGSPPAADLFEIDLPVKYLNQIEEAKKFLISEDPAVICISGNFPEFFDWLEQLNSSSVKLYCTSLIDAGLWKRAVNSQNLYKIFSPKIDAFEQKKILFEAFQHYLDLDLRSQLLKQSKKQLRELESLNEGLERMVAERTQHIEKSQQEEEEKLSQARNFMRLLKELVRISSVEELLLILRKEFRKFNRVGDPIVLLRMEGDKDQVAALMNGQVLVAEDHFQLIGGQHFSENNRPMGRQLAEILKRPIAKIATFPLGLKACLIIEHSLHAKEMDEFVHFIGDRLQAIEMTVDQLLLGQTVKKDSYRWEKTFDGIRDPIAIIDEDYNLIRSNRAFVDRSFQRKCFEVFASRNIPCEHCPLQDSLKNEEPLHRELSIRQRKYLVHSYPISLKNAERRTSVVHQYVDVTQKRELYLRMLQSEKMEAMGLLAGNIAHELNNPLTGLRALSQVLIQDYRGQGQIEQDLTEIEKATARSQKIIKNLLDFSQGGSQELRLISVRELIERTLPMLKTALRMHRLKLDLFPGEDFILVEPHLFQQVIFNLVNNACQAMKENGVVTLRTRVADDHLIFEVRDQGPGVPEAMKEQIFEPFFTTKQEGLGTGLGLSISKKIVESLSGKIEVQNAEDSGAIFRVTLKKGS
ncbi:MAG: ATP-binding protein [Proteobacteria bacterium]|jgi:signal transduction histidine kinase|nr:ATP-binding protein [Pseudomonadota bacterium]